MPLTALKVPHGTHTSKATTFSRSSYASVTLRLRVFRVLLSSYPVNQVVPTSSATDGSNDTFIYATVRQQEYAGIRIYWQL